MNKSLLRENKGILLVLLGVFALMLVLNSMTPLFADDYIYLLNLHSERPLSSFGDVVDSIDGFRSMHNGRVAAHFFAQLFLWLPKPLFVFVNSAMCTALVFLIFLFIKSGDKTKDTFMTVLAFAMIWVLMMGFGHAMLWRTGACSYLWAAVFLTAFIYPFYRQYMSGRECRGGVLSTALAIAYAFFAGSYSESGAFSALAITFCFLALIVIRERKLPVGLTVRFVSACAGFLWLMLAPSELGKKNVSADSQTLEQLGKIGVNLKVIAILVLVAILAVAFAVWALRKNRRLCCKLVALLVAAAMVAVVALTAFGLEANGGLLSKLNALMSETLLGLVLLFGTYAVAFCVYLTQKEIDGKLAMTALVMGVGALASIAVFFVADYFPARATCVTTVYLSIANILIISAGYKNKVCKLGMIVLLAVFIPSLIAGGSDIINVGSQYQERKLVISQAQAEGAEEIDIDPLLAQGKYAVAWQGEAFDYFNAMEVYYGIRQIRIEGAKYW